jgi:hypothetical protein
MMFTSSNDNLEEIWILSHEAASGAEVDSKVMRTDLSEAEAEAQTLSKEATSVDEVAEANTEVVEETLAASSEAVVEILEATEETLAAEAEVITTIEISTEEEAEVTTREEDKLSKEAAGVEPTTTIEAKMSDYNYLQNFVYTSA